MRMPRRRPSEPDHAPAHEDEPTFYSDWSDPRQYSIGDIGKGECAGEVVTQYEFEMTGAERIVYLRMEHPCLFGGMRIVTGTAVEGRGRESQM